MNKEIIQIQLGLFFKSNYSESFEKFALKLKEKLGESKLTQYIPINNNAPSEIPRLILSYEKFNINVSKNRLDFFTKDKELIDENIGNVFKSLEEFSISIFRIGFVKNFFIDEAMENLKNILVKDKVQKMNNLKELNIRINNNKSIVGYDCNSIENLSNGYVVIKNGNGTTKKNGLIAVRDINTIASIVGERKPLSLIEINKLLLNFNTESEKFILIDC